MDSLEIGSFENLEKYESHVIDLFSRPKQNYREIMYHAPCYPHDFFRTLIASGMNILFGCMERTPYPETQKNGTEYTHDFHYHFLADWTSVTETQERSYRNAFVKKRLAPCEYGNASSICKIKYGIKQKLEYIAKSETLEEKPHIVVNTVIISPSDIENLHQDFWSRKADLRLPKHQSSSKKENSKNTLLTIEKFVQERLESDTTSWSHGWNTQQVGKYIVEYYRINDKVFNKFYMINLAITLCARHNRETDENSDADIWNRLIDPRNLY